MFRLLPLILLLIAASCTPGASGPTPTPTPPPLTGEVNVETPQDGSIIYAELLYVSGTARDLPPEGFRLQLVGSDEELLFEQSVRVEGERWQVEIPHGFSGVPSEAALYILPADPVVEGDYGVISLALASLDQRPEGSFATIRAPGAGAVVGGDEILTYGTASGLFENTFILRLEQDGAVIDEQIITINNPYFVDDVSWTASLRTQGRSGNATIRAVYISAMDGSENILAEVAVLLTTEAG